VKPFLLVLSAPSGGGKTSIAKRLMQARGDLGYSVSATTRPIRAGERNGEDYHFVTRAEFERRQKNGEFLEWATYAGELYGTLRSEVDRIFAQGQNAVLDVEIEGARQIRRTMPDALLLFVLPPSADELLRRLTGRKTEDPGVLKQRVMRAADELAAVEEYDYVVVNEDLDDAVSQVAAILDAESCRTGRRSDVTKFVLDELRHDVIAAAEKIGKKKTPGGSSSRTSWGTPLT
jgi:guanylate kinase